MIRKAYFKLIIKRKLSLSLKRHVLSNSWSPLTFLLSPNALILALSGVGLWCVCIVFCFVFFFRLCLIQRKCVSFKRGRIMDSFFF